MSVRTRSPCLPTGLLFPQIIPGTEKAHQKSAVVTLAPGRLKFEAKEIYPSFGFPTGSINYWN